MNSMKRILTIVGARPQIIKSAAISRAISSQFTGQLEEIILHTGQHYDHNMSAVFFNEMGIPEPHVNLAVGSGNHGAQTAEMIVGIEKAILEFTPDAVLVYGDTNSTVAGALASTKLHIPVIHVEAGLRSFDKLMPEEINRISTDHMSTLLFTPTISGLENLKREGFSWSHERKASVNNPKVFHCGDIMYDNSLYFESLSKADLLIDLGIENSEFILVTVHRDTNTDDAERLNGIVEAIHQIQHASGSVIVLPLHPRTRKMMDQQLTDHMKELLYQNNHIKLIDPVGFLDMIALESHASLVITDSGGVQKEAYFFKKPCLILRETTEWIEIVENGSALLVGSETEKIVNGYHQLISTSHHFPSLYGDGKAAEFICQTVLDEL